MPRERRSDTLPDSPAWPLAWVETGPDLQVKTVRVRTETGQNNAMHKLITLAEQPHIREKRFNFQIGDSVDVHTRILDGDKERIQIYSGVVISMRGAGMGEMFTVRRIVASEGVERTFPINSPKIADVVVKRHGVVRRAKLYFLRDRVGKKTRLTERRAKASSSDE